MITITDGKTKFDLPREAVGAIINALYDSKSFMARYNSTFAKKELEKANHLIEIFDALEVE